MEPQIVEKIWSIDPATVFGALVFMLAAANFLQWRRITHLQDIIIQQNEDYNRGLKAIVSKFIDNEQS